MALSSKEHVVRNLSSSQLPTPSSFLASCFCHSLLPTVSIRLSPQHLHGPRPQALEIDGSPRVLFLLGMVVLVVVVGRRRGLTVVQERRLWVFVQEVILVTGKKEEMSE